MESPPPYMPPAPKRNTGLIVGLIIGGIVLCCVLPVGLIGGFGYWAFGKAKPLVACTMAFTNVRDSVLDYAHDHNGKLPKAATWMDDVRPYYTKKIASGKQDDAKQMFGGMPAEGVWGCADADGNKTGMAYNKDLDGKTLDSIKDKVSTIVVFETAQASMNLSQKYEPQPDASSPKMMGKPRGWFKAPLEGDLRGIRNSRWRAGSNGNFQVDVNKGGKSEESGSSSKGD